MEQGLKIVLTADVNNAEKQMDNFASSALKSAEVVSQAFDNAAGGVNDFATTAVKSAQIVGKSFADIEPEIDAIANAFNDKWTKIIQQTEGEAKAIDDQVKSFGKLYDTVQKFGGGVKAFTPVAAQLTSIKKPTVDATYAITNLGRVLQDSSYGFIGIANNLNPLLESFQSLSLRAKDAGVSIKSVLLQSLQGPAGLGLALSAVTAALQFAQIGFSAWTRGFGDTSKHTKQAGDSMQYAKEQISSLDQELTRVAQTASQDAAKIQILFSAISEANVSLTERKSIIGQLGQISDKYFGNLDKEKATYEQIAKAVQDYNDNIVNTVRIKALLPEYEKLYKGLIDAQIQIQKNKELAGTPLVDDKSLEEETKSLTNFVKRRNAELGKAKEYLTQLAGDSKSLDEILFGKSSENTKTTSEKISDKITDLLNKLQISRDRLKDDPLIPSLDKPRKDIELIEDAIQRLLELKVPNDSTIISKLIGQEDFNALLSAEFKKLNLKKPAELEAPVEVQPVIQITHPDDFINEANRKKMIEIMQSAGKKTFVKSDSLGIGIRVPITASMNLKDATEAFTEFKDNIQAMGQIITQSLTQPFQEFFTTLLTGSGNAIEALMNALKQLIVRLIATALAAAAVAAILSAAGIGVFNGTKTISDFKGIFGVLSGFKFAEGGVVSGPTRALVGEYPGAASNPEVIAPLSKLKTLIKGSGEGGSQVFIPEVRLEGPDLVIAFNRANKAYSR